MLNPSWRLKYRTHWECWALVPSLRFLPGLQIRRTRRGQPATSDVAPRVCRGLPDPLNLAGNLNPRTEPSADTFLNRWWPTLDGANHSDTWQTCPMDLAWSSLWFLLCWLWVLKSKWVRETHHSNSNRLILIRRNAEYVWFLWARDFLSADSTSEFKGWVHTEWQVTSAKLQMVLGPRLQRDLLCSQPLLLPQNDYWGN